MTDYSVGYLAGIIDGEGCVYVNRRKATGRRRTPGYGVKVCVSITSRALVDWFVAKARLTSVHHVEQPGGNRKPKWLCTWNNSAAEWLLGLVLPHLVIKKRQAELGLELLKHLRETTGRRGVAVSPGAVEYREGIKAKIAVLNARGVKVA